MSIDSAAAQPTEDHKAMNRRVLITGLFVLLLTLSISVWKGNAWCSERFEADKQTGVYSLSSDVIEDVKVER